MPTASLKYVPRDNQSLDNDGLALQLAHMAAVHNANDATANGRKDLNYASGYGVKYAETLTFGKYTVWPWAHANDFISIANPTRDAATDISFSASYPNNGAYLNTALGARFAVAVYNAAGGSGTVDYDSSPTAHGAGDNHIVFGPYGGSTTEQPFAINGLSRTLATLSVFQGILDVDFYNSSTYGLRYWIGAGALPAAAGSLLTLRLLGFWR